MASIIAIPDCHFPFHCERTLEKAIKHIDKLKPDYVVQLGDLFDLYALSRFPKLFHKTPAQEVAEARACAEEMWDEVRKASPKSKLIQLVGNHDYRAKRLIVEKAPELEPFVTITDWFTFDKVKTIYDPREGYEIDSVLFIHGFLNGPGAHAMFFNKRVCRGHSHNAGIVFYNRHGDSGDRIWEAQSGYLGATGSLPFRFTPSSFTNWQRGITEIIDKIPRFIPL